MRRVLLSVVFGMASASMASAASITIGQVDGPNFNGVLVNYSLDVGEETISGRAQLGSVLMSNGTGFTDPALNQSAFEAYCVEILGPIFNAGTNPGDQPPGSTFQATDSLLSTWTSTNPPGQPNGASNAAALYNQFNPLIQFQTGPIAALGGADADVARTALQMAIWNVLYDTDRSVSTGLFTATNVGTTNDVVSLANSFLSQLPANTTGSDAAWIQLTQNCTNDNGAPQSCQDFMGPVPTSPVPEPASVLLFGTGLAAVGFTRLRRRA